MSIRSRILLGCLALTLLAGLLGLFAQRSERRLGSLAFNIYDNAFMSVSYLREAQADFSKIVGGLNKAAAPRSAKLFDEVIEDLDVVRQRAMSAQGRSQAETLRRHMTELLPHLSTQPEAAMRAEAEFDRLVETFADDGFRYRRDVAHMVKAQRSRTLAALCGTLVAALAITALVTRLIAPPVRRAVRIAQSIAAGQLDNAIDATGRGETGDLLRALSEMQSSIAAAMAQINALLAEQAKNHAGEIATQHAQQQAALANMSQGLCLFGADGRLKVSNPRFAEMFGNPEPDGDAERVLRMAGLEALVEISRGGAVESFSCELADGRSIAVSQQPIASGGWVATYDDVSERRAAESRLAHMARHDVLTGLPNRLLFGEHLRKTLAELGTERGVAVFCLDLDQFKAVNDMFGHGVGDALLRAVAERLQSCVRKGDLVVRLGGDEFAVVQNAADRGIEQVREATALARRLVGELAAPYDIQHRRIVIAASVGIALCGDGNTSPETLLKQADLALYRSKASDRGSFHFFEAEMDTRMQARRLLEQDLREAITNQQFEVFYQPLIHRAGIAGFEALVRWNHPVRGMVSPAEFIPAAEDIGLIPVLGRWVLKQACSTAASWPGGLKIAVNLSALQFRTGLVEEVTDALASSGLPPKRLELEITESVLLQDDEQVLTMLHAIRALGVRIAMDDFGTGYSSLGYLRRFPFDKIKIDQSFVQGMTEQEDCLAIVRAVIGLGRSLGIAINAEGVETTAQHEALIREGCGELQGYLFSRPRPAAAVGDLLAQFGCAAHPLHAAA